MSQLLTAPPAGAAPLPAPPTAEDRVAALWARHEEAAGRQRRARTELAHIRAELGAELSAVKTRLTKAGRRGQWGSWLETRGIPRATADRLVARHRHPHPEPPAPLAAKPLPADLQPALGQVLALLRPFSLADRFRCLEALGPALELVCHYHGAYDDLLIEDPPDEEDEQEGEEEETEEAKQSKQEHKDQESAPAKNAPAASAPARATGMAQAAAAAAGNLAPAACHVDVAAAPGSHGSNSSLRNFSPRAGGAALRATSLRPACRTASSRPCLSGQLGTSGRPESRRPRIGRHPSSSLRNFSRHARGAGAPDIATPRGAALRAAFRPASGGPASRL